MQTVTLTEIAVIATGHWFADFFCQTRQIAKTKSKCLMALSCHVLIYTYGLMCFAIWLWDWYFFWIWLCVNGVLHWCTDFVTSRLTTYFYQQSKYHTFWCVVGFDQLLHILVLFGTLVYFKGWL